MDLVELGGLQQMNFSVNFTLSSLLFATFLKWHLSNVYMINLQLTHFVFVFIVDYSRACSRKYSRLSH